MQEFEGDLAGAVFWGADLTGARFRDVNLTGARISHAWVVDVEIDALVDRLVVNGVDVTDFVHEHDRWYPLRARIRAPEPAGMREAWALLEQEWAATIGRALALPEDALHASVGGEWSFVQTMQHLVFAMDKWFTVPILGDVFHPAGVPNSGSVDFPWPGLDGGAAPSAPEILAVREERGARFRDYLAAVAPEKLNQPVEILENGTNPIRECIHTVLEEEFWHHRYALRDLEQLEAGGAG